MQPVHHRPLSPALIQSTRGYRQVPIHIDTVPCGVGMDARRQQQGGCLPANINGLPPTFQQYLRASFAYETSLPLQYHQHYLPRQQRSLPTSQYISRQRLRAAQQPASTMNPALNNYNQPFSTGYSEEDAKVFMRGDFDVEAYTSGLVGRADYNTNSALYNPHQFRPLQSAHLHFNQQNTGIMPLRTTYVDPREYSPVLHEEAMNTPYAVSSPSSADTDDDFPATPVDQPSLFYGHHDANYAPPDSYSLSAASHNLNPQPLHSSTGSFSSGSAIALCGSFSSDSSASFSASDSNGQAYPPYHPTNPQHLRDSGVDHALSHDNFAAPAFTGLALASQAPEAVDDFSESDVEFDAASPASSSSGLEDGIRSERDQRLLDLRSQGYSYKEIKRIGPFTEAESTLRGRMRVLTKEKHERVRRPVWHASDVQLLHRAFKRFTDKPPTNSRRKPTAKVPWGKISTWMEHNGSSYAFAPATCARKWAEVTRK